MAANEDERIEPAEGSLRGRDGISRGSLLGEVAKTFCNRCAARFGLGGRSIEAGCVRACVQQERGTGRCQELCRGAADAAGGAGDEINAVDLGHHDVTLAGGNAPVRWKWLRKARVAASRGASITCRAGPSSTTTPSRMNTTRSATSRAKAIS